MERPLSDSVINMRLYCLKISLFIRYVCGPTVYDDAHLGHGRTMVTWDLLRRYWNFKGIPFLDSMSITDVDDKIISKAALQKCHYSAVTNHYTEQFMKDMSALNVFNRPIKIYKFIVIS